MDIITQKERDNLLVLSEIKGCYLDGERARIKGRLDPYAKICQMDGLLEVEFSWNAAKRIMNSSRCFKS